MLNFSEQLLFAHRLKYRSRFSDEKVDRNPEWVGPGRLSWVGPGLLSSCCLEVVVAVRLREALRPVLVLVNVASSLLLRAARFFTRITKTDSIPAAIEFSRAPAVETVHVRC